MKALIFKNELVQVAAADFPVTDEFQWVDVAADVTPETHKWNGTAVVPKPPKTAPELEVEASTLAKSKIAEIRANIFPDLLDFVAGLPGAPAKIKAARDSVNTEKAKVKP